MIAQKNRFHGHRSVSKVRGSAVRTPLVSAFFMPNRRSDFRLAVVVSKKIAKSAVVRNRIRRRLYETVRTQNLLSGKSVDAVLVVHTDALANIEQQQLEKTLTDITRKLTSRLNKK